MKVFAMKIKKLTQRVEELEQYSRLNNLEIKGGKSNDEPRDIVMNISNVVGEPVFTSDIDTCHKNLTRKPNEPNIIVRFVRREKRHAFFSNARKLKVSNKKLGFQDGGAVCVNEHLTPSNKLLLGAAIKSKSEVSWKIAWANGMKVFIRKNLHFEAFCIADRADLSKMSS